MCRRVFESSQQQPRSSSRGVRNSAKFEVTNELCLAINNIDYVLQFIKPFVTELGKENIDLFLKIRLDFLKGTFDEILKRTFDESQNEIALKIYYVVLNN